MLQNYGMLPDFISYPPPPPPPPFYVLTPTINSHLTLLDRLLGEQKGKCHGKDLFFTTKHYVRKVLKINLPFYKEAIKAMTTLDLRKQILDQREEKLFYNPIFQGKNEQTLKITKPCETAGIFTYCKLLDEVELRNMAALIVDISLIYPIALFYGI